MRRNLDSPAVASQTTLPQAPRALQRARVLVVGDVMLDRYWFGDVSRISPEAPVPVVKIDRIEERPGGAANVARNVAALGARCCLLSVTGCDEAGERVAELLKLEDVEPMLHRDKGIATTVKLRVISRHQQLLRVDFDITPSHEILTAALDDFKRRLKKTDVVVLSDYGKGGLTHIGKMIQWARQAGKPVLVDPKGDDFSRYRKATLLTPNRAEFKQVMGSWKNERELTRKAQQLRHELKLDALLITRSEAGMTLYREGTVLHEATQTREVFDVSGAGDTVIATLAVMLASGSDYPDAVHTANRAAGIVVGKLGTAVVARAELFA
ncbi:MAG: D-glycero-beta-D-manno-heptose-7-phosphate kinase [Burkholderiales bacterium]